MNTDGTQPRISSLTLPNLGTNWHVRCNNVPHGGLEFLVLSVGPAPSFRGLPAGNFTYGSYCCYVETIGRGGTPDYVFALPNHPLLAGLSLTVQWDIATGPSLVDPTFSNALAVVIR